MMRYNFLKPLLMAMFAVLALTACEQSKPCIDADDFGLPKITLNAAGQNIQGAENRQVSEWVDSGLVLVDNKLLLSVYGRWYPWTPGGIDANANTSNNGGDGVLSQNLVANHCTYVPMANAIDPGDTSCVRIPSKDWPCWLTRGMGVYGLAIETPASRGNRDGGYNAVYNPNRSMRDMRDPQEGTTFHLGDKSLDNLPPTGTDPYERADDGTPLRQIYFDTISDKGGGYDGDISALGKNGAKLYDHLYFKILDSFYADNAGSLVVKVRHGAANPNPGPIETLIKSIQDILSQSSEKIYQALVTNNDFIMAGRVMLVLYIMFYAVYFSIGMANITRKDLLVRFFKIGIIVALTGPTSFEFFTLYLFRLFTDGMLEIINLICDAIIGTGRNGGDVTRMVFFDDMLYKFTAWETHAKIWSLLFDPTVDWGGVMHPLKIEALVYIPIIYIAIFMFLIALAKCVMFYLIALIVISLLIAVAPIFIMFILFERTKSLFEDWLKQLISATLQPIIIMAFMSLLYVVIMQSLYDTVGYRACWDTWWTGEFWKESFIDVYPQGGFKFWMPNIRPDVWEYLWVPPFYNQTVNDVLIQASLQENATSAMSALQTSAPDLYNSILAQCGGQTSNLMYAVQDCRMVDYPSLDPDVYLDKIMRVSGGSAVTFLDILTFGIVIYLMLLFTDHVPAIARNLTGGRHAGTFESAVGGAWGAVSTIGGGALGLGARATGLSKVTGAVRRLKHDYQDAANTGFGMVKPGEGPVNKIKDGIGNIKPIKAISDKFDAAGKHIDKYAARGEKTINKGRDAMGNAIQGADGVLSGNPVANSAKAAYLAGTGTPRAISALNDKIKERKEEKKEEEAKKREAADATKVDDAKKDDAKKDDAKKDDAKGKAPVPVPTPGTGKAPDDDKSKPDPAKRQGLPDDPNVGALPNQPNPNGQPQPQQPPIVPNDPAQQSQQPPQAQNRQALSQVERDNMARDLGFKEQELNALKRDPLSKSDPKMRQRIQALEGDISSLKQQLN